MCNDFLPLLHSHRAAGPRPTFSTSILDWCSSVGNTPWFQGRAKTSRPNRSELICVKGSTLTLPPLPQQWCVTTAVLSLRDRKMISCNEENQGGIESEAVSCVETQQRRLDKLASPVCEKLYGDSAFGRCTRCCSAQFTMKFWSWKKLQPQWLCLIKTNNPRVKRIHLNNYFRSYFRIEIANLDQRLFHQVAIKTGNCPGILGEKEKKNCASL